MQLYFFLPIVGGIYGAFVGAYIKSENKTAAWKRALVIAGAVLVLLVIATLVYAFRK